MNAWSPRRARAGLLFSAVLALIGLVPAVYFLGLLVWQFASSLQAGKWLALPMSLVFTGHSFAFLPHFPWPWFMSPDSLLPLHNAISWVLGRVHVGLLFGVLGVAMVAIGVLGVLKHYAALRAYRQKSQDQARRVRDYERDDLQADSFGRREPYIIQYPKTSYDSSTPKERWSARG